MNQKEIQEQLEELLIRVQILEQKVKALEEEN